MRSLFSLASSLLFTVAHLPGIYRGHTILLVPPPISFQRRLSFAVLLLFCTRHTGQSPGEFESPLASPLFICFSSSSGCGSCLHLPSSPDFPSIAADNVESATVRSRKLARLIHEKDERVDDRCRRRDWIVKSPVVRANKRAARCSTWKRSRRVAARWLVLWLIAATERKRERLWPRNWFMRMFANEFVSSNEKKKKKKKETGPIVSEWKMCVTGRNVRNSFK